MLLPHCIIFVSSVFWGGREGFLSIHNTDVAAELKHMANFFKMAVSKCAHDNGIHSKVLVCLCHTFSFASPHLSPEYKEKIGLKCQFLIEPKPKEPCRHQYDYGKASRISTKQMRFLSLTEAFYMSMFPSIDAMSVIGFLKHYGLESHFKLNIEPNHTTLAGHSYEHDIVMAST